MAKKQSLEKKKLMKEQSLQRKAARVKEENKILGHCLGLLGVLAVAEIYFLMCDRFYAQGTTDTMLSMASAINVIGWIGLALFVIGLVAALVRRGKKYGHVCAWGAMLGAILFVGRYLMLNIYPLGTVVMCVAVPLFALAGFVYYLYQREFFFTGLGLGLALFGMWLARRSVGSANWSTRYLIVEGVLLAVVLVLLVFCVMVGRNGGRLGQGETAKQIFSGATRYWISYGTLALSAVGLIAVMVAPMIGLYLMWTGMAVLFVIAVYYTVHLM